MKEMVDLLGEPPEDFLRRSEQSSRLFDENDKYSVDCSHDGAVDQIADYRFVFSGKWIAEPPITALPLENRAKHIQGDSKAEILDFLNLCFVGCLRRGRVRGNCLGILGCRDVRIEEYDGLTGTLEDDDLVIQHQALQTGCRETAWMLNMVRSFELMNLGRRGELPVALLRSSPPAIQSDELNHLSKSVKQDRILVLATYEADSPASDRCSTCVACKLFTLSNATNPVCDLSIDTWLPSLFCRCWRLKLRLLIEYLRTDTNIIRTAGAQAHMIASCISAMHHMRRLPPVHEVSGRSPSWTSQ
jgi:hypothetical protein